MSGVKSGEPVLAAVVAERQPDERLRRRLAVGAFGFRSLELDRAAARHPHRPGQETQQLLEGGVDQRRRHDGAGVLGEVDGAVVVVRHHHVARVHARDAADRFVLALAEHVAGELTVAAGDDVDVLTDLCSGAGVDGEGKAESEENAGVSPAARVERIAASVRTVSQRARVETTRCRPRMTRPCIDPAPSQHEPGKSLRVEADYAARHSRGQ